MAACPSGAAWDFYLINDSAQPLVSAVLERVEWEWGDRTFDTKTPSARVDNVAPGAAVFLWRDVDEELRMTLRLRVQQQGPPVTIEFSFPLIYKRRDQLRPIPEIGAVGWVQSADG